MLSKTRFAFGVVCILIVGCNTSDSVEGSASQSLAINPFGIWVETVRGYGFQCECPQGPICGCYTDLCPAGEPEGQSCAPLGATCKELGSDSKFSEFTCVTPPQDPSPTYHWTRTTTDTCSDACGRSARDCSCLQSLCDGNPENQSCSTHGVSCDVYTSGSTTWFELTCE